MYYFHFCANVDMSIASLRFGSVVTGAIQAKLLSKKATKGAAKDSPSKKKHKGSSFSFLGGMQVNIGFGKFSKYT